MGLQLPGEQISFLGMIGFSRPEADEVALFEMGQAWISFSDTIGEYSGAAATGVAAVWDGNQGGDITAFRQWWHAEDSPASALESGALRAVLTGTGLIICAAIVLVLKIMVIVQLVILAVLFLWFIGDRPRT